LLLFYVHDAIEIRVFDHHELAFRDLPALHELVALDLTVVRRAPALLLDRRQALAVQRAERHVGLPRRRLRCQGHPDGNVDQAEADGAVPDRPHEENELYSDPSFPPIIPRCGRSGLSGRTLSPRTARTRPTWSRRRASGARSRRKKPPQRSTSSRTASWRWA